MTEMVTNRTSKDAKYNYTDLNRVEVAAAEVAGLLNSEGYYVTIHTKTDWARGDKPPKAQMDRYIGNLHQIRGQFTEVPGAPLPASMKKIDYRDANNIEKFLEGVPKLIAEMQSGYRRCNTFNCGT